MDDYHKGKGYIGDSMSVNASEAYDDGRMPLSKWSKDMLLDLIDENRDQLKCDYDLLVKQPLEVLKTLLLTDGGEYHHVGIRKNIVYFYYFDTNLLSNLTDDHIRSVKDKYTADRKQKEIQKQQDLAKMSQNDGRWKISYIKRSADGKHRTEYVLTGEVKNGWFYIDPGSKLQDKTKLSIKGKDFKFLDRIK